jgi:hypothetical protein
MRVCGNGYDAQSLWLSPQSVPRLLSTFIILLNESHTQHQDVAPLKTYPLRLRARLKLRNCYGVRRPRVVRKHTILGEKFHEIQKNTAAAYAMICPVYDGLVNTTRKSARTTKYSGSQFACVSDQFGAGRAWNGDHGEALRPVYFTCESYERNTNQSNKYPTCCKTSRAPTLESGAVRPIGFRIEYSILEDRNLYISKEECVRYGFRRPSSNSNLLFVSE